MYDYSKLRGRIIEKYGKYSKFCNAAGMQVQNLRKRLNNETRFNTDDIEKFTTLLDLSNKEIIEYFFTKKV